MLIDGTSGMLQNTEHPGYQSDFHAPGCPPRRVSALNGHPRERDIFIRLDAPSLWWTRHCFQNSRGLAKTAVIEFDRSFFYRKAT